MHHVTLYFGCDDGTRDAWDCDCGHGGSGPSESRYDVELHAEGHVKPGEQASYRTAPSEPR